MLLALALLLGASCQVEWVAPGGRAGASCSNEPSGELWVYSSFIPAVLDGVQALCRQKLPKVDVHWVNGGSEKIASRLDAELSAGAALADVVTLADPFLFERLKSEGRLTPFVPVAALRLPPSLVDPDGAFVPTRLSTMVLAFPSGLSAPPKAFGELAAPRFKDDVALGDPLVSGTHYTWAVFVARRHGERFFTQLAENGAVVAGGNSAVMQKLESGEAQVGVLSLEAVLLAKAQGRKLAFALPEDGAVLVPSHAALLEGTKNPVAAKALLELLLSPAAQELFVRAGAFHPADVRRDGPASTVSGEALIAASAPWTPEVLSQGKEDRARLKRAFADAFQRRAP